ncbi:hypothetical protein Cylst_0219 [Cylindrospermum stagnale PCC 7417]|uniref:Uncharacterized protein n=1 Tax=Cylindrospermum stagnale PCC 7417 TaxID=56107 RepID=K9WS38_9NOST|nr:hypothetical protein [Cylindrospermum stagnale]AFZ22594.1 hypothetical protein Cylst_0219 [Cylindrospermum stagnale PCC 7417]
MALNFVNSITETILLATSLLAVIPPQNQVPDSNGVIVAHTKILASYQSKTPRPSTKKATISVEGEKIPIALRLYQYSDLLTTYFPEKDFIAEASSSGEGQSVRFFANFGGKQQKNAYVHFAFLNGLKNLGQVKSFVNGKNGLIASNGWRVVNRTRNLPYSWAKEKIVFRGSKNLVGAVYIGEQKGKAFYVITHFPGEYGDGFPPRADLILRNLQVGGG